jgi:hypothetical protein
MEEFHGTSFGDGVDAWAEKRTAGNHCKIFATAWQGKILPGKTLCVSGVVSSKLPHRFTLGGGSMKRGRLAKPRTDDILLPLTRTNPSTLSLRVRGERSVQSGADCC